MLKKDQKSYSAILWLVQLVLGISLVFANDSISLEFGEIDSENQIVPILYNSTSDITGFQFFIIGMDVTNIFGGTAEEYNFYLHQGSTCWRGNECKDVVTGFSNSDSPIPPGEGILFYLNYAEVEDDIFDNNIQISYQTCLDINEGFIVGPQDNLFDVDLGELEDGLIAIDTKINMDLDKFKSFGFRVLEKTICKRAIIKEIRSIRLTI